MAVKDDARQKEVLTSEAVRPTDTDIDSSLSTEISVEINSGVNLTSIYTERDCLLFRTPSVYVHFCIICRDDDGDKGEKDDGDDDNDDDDDGGGGGGDDDDEYDNTAELCSSSDMDVSSATHGKPEKICLVCGDKALGYNFNAVSCESCKAFFRRNAHKNIRGRCEGHCEVTVESRSFCKRCRLAKCFTVGMRKDMILNEEQKKQRKQKIITNKLRRQGQLTPGVSMPGVSVPYGAPFQQHYLKPGTPRDLHLTEIPGTAPGKPSGEDFMMSRPHHIRSHLMAQHYPRHHDLYPMGGYPVNLGKSSASQAVSTASSPSLTSYNCSNQPFTTPPGERDASASASSSSSSPAASLQHTKYYPHPRHHHNHHHHHHHHHHEQQREQHLHHDRQHYNHQSHHNQSRSCNKLPKYHHFEQHERSHNEQAPPKAQIQHVPSMHIKQEVPDSIADSPEATSTHSPLPKFSPQPHVQQPQFTHSPKKASSINYPGGLHHQAASLYPSPQNHLQSSTIPTSTTTPSPISPSSTTSPRLCITPTSSTFLPTAQATVFTATPTKITTSSTSSFTNSGNSFEANDTTAATVHHKIVPWSQSQELVEAAINSLGPEGASDVREMMHAMEVGTFFGGNRLIKAIPNTPEEFVNTAELFVRKVIKFAKNLRPFKSLVRSDQVGLLKSSVVDIMMLRSAVNYDPFSETWNLNTKGCMTQGADQAAGARISADILKSGSSNTKKLFMTYSRFIKSLMSLVHGDRVVLELLILMSLFAADRVPLEQHDRIQGVQENYAYLLHRYVAHRFDMEPTLFARIVMKLADLRDINEIHSDMLLHLKVDELDPLLVEIFELPPSADSDADAEMGPAADENVKQPVEETKNYGVSGDEHSVKSSASPTSTNPLSEPSAQCPVPAGQSPHIDHYPLKQEQKFRSRLQSPQPDPLPLPSPKDDTPAMASPASMGMGSSVGRTNFAFSPTGVPMAASESLPPGLPLPVLSSPFVSSASNAAISCRRKSESLDLYSPAKDAAIRGRCMSMTARPAEQSDLNARASNF
ncbi:vitamin D3 receptor a [Plakobranchus ocellatus]|uniref:Vitamin D3 receptor a n=1 Tax=Plakobranchus ocellatus TaxID=259542 RepID=A0AAV4DSE4_9GAST|nr:vitamin D3 receptor a [Plakobranchus ocellatus]